MQNEENISCQAIPILNRVSVSLASIQHNLCEISVAHSLRNYVLFSINFFLLLCWYYVVSFVKKLKAEAILLKYHVVSYKTMLDQIQFIIRDFLDFLVFENLEYWSLDLQLLCW